MGGRSGYSGVSGAGATNTTPAPAPAPAPAVVQTARPVGLAAPAPVSSLGGSSGGITIPKPVTNVSQQNITAAANAAGLEDMSFRSLTNNDIGKTFVVTEPVMTGPLSNRNNPDSVRFMKLTYVGRQNNAFAQPIFQTSTGQRFLVDENERYVRLFKKAGT